MSDETAGSRIIRDVLSFSIKTCIAAAAVWFVATWIIADVNDDITDTVTKVSLTLKEQQIGGHQFWSKVEKALDDVAKSDLPADKKEKLLRDVRVIVARYRPFVDAIKDGMNEQPPPGQH